MRVTNFCITLLFFAFVGICQAQTGAISKSDLRGLIMDRFVTEFRPDYALFNHHGAGLIRKGEQWSSVMLWDMQYPIRVGKDARKVDVTERVISPDLALEILAESTPDSLFSIGQERFDALPEKCEGESGMKRGIYGLFDGGTVVIWEYTRKTKRKIQFYGAESYYKTCYPYQPEFEILGTLLNTFRVLGKYAPKRSSSFTGLGE